MPTYDEDPRFWRDWKRLTPEQRTLFLGAVHQMVAALKAKQPFPPGLRIKGYQSEEGVFEMSWAKDGRALFEYGAPRSAGDVHIRWLRIGTHAIFEEK